MSNIISIDPGVMSGYCYASYTEDRLKVYPFQIVDEVDDCWRRLVELKPQVIIIEDFEFRRGKYAAGGLNLFPQQLIGVTKLYSLICDHQCGYYLQKAAQGKAFYSNEALKARGLYKRGIPHATDALRHLLQWFTFGAGYQYLGNNKIEDFVEIVDEWREG